MMMRSGGPPEAGARTESGYFSKRGAGASGIGVANCSTKKKRRLVPAQLSTTEKEEKSGTAREVSHLSRASNGGKRYLNSMTDHPEIGFKKISTRRFWARPASVALSATGCVWPRPSALRRLRATPRSPR